jgi:hypothetical protein
MVIAWSGDQVIRAEQQIPCVVIHPDDRPESKDFRGTADH